MSETSKSEPRRIRERFYSKYCNGKVLDIGYAATGGETMTGIDVTGLDIDTPGYDGLHIPYDDETFDTVYSSHMLEHMHDDIAGLREQYRVVKKGGYIIVVVPHQWLYEKKDALPSRFNGDHKRFYTPATLLANVEKALEPNTYRIRYLQDCDDGYDYSLPAETPPIGEYQIELVIQKL